MMASFLAEEELAKLAESTQPELTDLIVEKAKEKISSLEIELERTKTAYELQLEEQEKQVERLREDFNAYKAEHEALKQKQPEGDDEGTKLTKELEASRASIAAYESKVTLQTDRISSAEEVSFHGFHIEDLCMFENEELLVQF